MPYYRTIEEDLERAKQIVAEGKTPFEGAPLVDFVEPHVGGTIYGKDIYAAYKLLESFVTKIESDKFYYRDLEEHMRRVVKETKGAPSMVLRDNKPYKVIPEDLADAIEKLV